VRLRSRLFTLLLALPALGTLSTTAAFASDLQCTTTHQPAERVICDHAILNNEYDDIYAQQQNLLSAGKLSPQDIAGWKQARNGCNDVHCVDSVFAQWKTIAQNAQARAGTAATAAPPAVAQLPDLAPGSGVPQASAVLPASEPSAADAQATASAPSDASQVRQGSAAGIAMPQAVDPSVSAASDAGASAPASSEATGSRMTGIGPGLPIAIAIVLLIAIGAGVVFMRRTKR